MGQYKLKKEVEMSNNLRLASVGILTSALAASLGIRKSCNRIMNPDLKIYKKETGPLSTASSELVEFLIPRMKHWQEKVEIELNSGKHEFFVSQTPKILDVILIDALNGESISTLYIGNCDKGLRFSIVTGDGINSLETMLSPKHGFRHYLDRREIDEGEALHVYYNIKKGVV